MPGNFATPHHRRVLDAQAKMAVAAEKVSRAKPGSVERVRATEELARAGRAHQRARHAETVAMLGIGR